jgi:hypothetical protein
VAGAALIALFTWHASRRGSAALRGVSLFRRRGFAAASATTFMLGVALFGSLILIPLYYQIVRGQSPLQVGLLLVPPGVARPVAGRAARHSMQIPRRAVQPRHAARGSRSRR